MSEQDAALAEKWQPYIRELIECGRKGVTQGLTLASAGNLSVRDLETGEYIVTATGTFLDELTPGDFALMGPNGDHLAGPRPSSEWRLHHEVYAARPDATVVFHMHPEFAVLVDATGTAVRQFMLDHVAYVPRVVRIPFYPNGSTILATEAAAALKDEDVLILGNHGCSVVSTSTSDAFRKVLNLEQSARMTYRLMQIGDTTTEFPQELRATAIHS